MIVTIISLAITALFCLIYFAPLMDYLSSEYWMARRISPEIASEDLKESAPDICDLAKSIQSTLAVIITVLRLCRVSVGYLSGAIGIFVVASIVFFIALIASPYNRVKEILSVILGIIAVAVFCLII